MLDQMKEVLARLRRSLSGKAEDAYDDRDAAGGDSRREAYASGEAHAYGVAADEARDAEAADAVAPPQSGPPRDPT